MIKFTSVNLILIKDGKIHSCNAVYVPGEGDRVHRVRISRSVYLGAADNITKTSLANMLTSLLRGTANERNMGTEFNVVKFVFAGEKLSYGDMPLLPGVIVLDYPHSLKAGSPEMHIVKALFGRIESEGDKSGEG